MTKHLGRRRKKRITQGCVVNKKKSEWMDYEYTMDMTKHSDAENLILFALGGGESNVSGHYL